jgi:hypothetical protein
MATITRRVVRSARRRGITVRGRRAWGSRQPHVYAWRRIFRRARTPADTVVQHITVTHPKPIELAAREVERIGMERFGSGVSYNFLVHMQTGEVAVGQPLDAKGTHTLNEKRVPGYSYDQNLVARAIAVIGMPDTPLSAKAQSAIEGLLAAMIAEKAITPGFDYDPHSKFAWKDCPCDPTRDRMPDILRAARRGASP